MVDAWPAGMPQYILQSGASLGFGDGLLETQPDVGPPISRRRSTAVTRPLRGSVMCTNAQITTFETFFYTTILNGSLPFSFPDPRTGATILVKFIKGSPPSYSPQGGNNFLLNLDLVVLP